MMLFIIVVDFFVGGKALLVSVGVDVVGLGIGGLIVGTAHKAVGDFEQIVDGGEEQAEKQSVEESVDMELADQLGGEEDDAGVDDEQEEAHGDDSEGKGEDNEDGTDEVVEKRDDGSGEDGSPEGIDMNAGHDVGCQNGGQCHDNHLRYKTQGTGIRFRIVVDCDFHSGRGVRLKVREEEVASGIAFAATGNFDVAAGTVDDSGRDVLTNAAVNN